MKINAILFPTAFLLAFSICATAQKPSAKPTKPAQKYAQKKGPSVHFAPGGYGHNSPRQGGKNRTDAPDLKLTDAQKTKVMAIKTAERKSMRAIMSNPKLSEDAKRKKMMDLGKQSNTKMSALLTPVQKKKLDLWRKEHIRSRQGPKPSAVTPKPKK